MQKGFVTAYILVGLVFLLLLLGGAYYLNKSNTATAPSDQVQRTTQSSPEPVKQSSQSFQEILTKNCTKIGKYFNRVEVDNLPIKISQSQVDTIKSLDKNGARCEGEYGDRSTGELKQNERYVQVKVQSNGSLFLYDKNTIKKRESDGRVLTPPYDDFDVKLVKDQQGIKVSTFVVEPLDTGSTTEWTRGEKNLTLSNGETLYLKLDIPQKNDTALVEQILSSVTEK